MAEKGKMEKGKAEDDDVEGQKGEFYVVDEEGGFGLELEELLRASAYVVGKSRNGIVYKVVVGRGVSVAVRRLGEGGLWKFKEFEAEVEAIARVRHRNVVRLRAYYYATDEKLLVSDFISNGSLHAALHGTLHYVSFFIYIMLSLSRNVSALFSLGTTYNGTRCEFGTF